MRLVSFLPTPLRAPASAAVRRLGKRLGIDAGYFVHNGVIASLTYAATVASGLVTGYLVARMFPPELYGGYKFVIGIVGTVSLISLPGLGSAISRAIVRQKDKAPLRHTLRLNAALCLLGSLLLLGCIPLLHLWGRQELWPLFVMASVLFVPNQVGSTFFSGIVTGTERFSTSLRVTVKASLLVIPTVLFMLFLHPSPVALMAFAVGIPAALYLRELRIHWKKYPSEQQSGEIIRYGASLSLNTIPMTLSAYLDTLLVSVFFGLNSLAVFAVSVLIPEQIKVWSKYLLPVSFARQAAGDDTAARRRKLFRMVGLATMLFAIGVAAYILIAPWLLPLLFPRYGAQMDDVVLFSRISALILLLAPWALFPQYLEARGKVHELRACQWLSAALFAVALLLLIPRFGPLGAILSRGIFRIAYLGFAALQVWRMPYGERVRK